MPTSPLSYQELVNELTLNDDDILLVYGSACHSARLMSDSVSELIASVLVEMGVKPEEIYKLSLGVCQDEKTKLYLLLMAPIFGFMTVEHFGEINRGDLAVVDFDHLIKSLRSRIEFAGQFAEHIFQRK